MLRSEHDDAIAVGDALVVGGTALRVGDAATGDAAAAPGQRGDDDAGRRRHDLVGHGAIGDGARVVRAAVVVVARSAVRHDGGRGRGPGQHRPDRDRRAHAGDGAPGFVALVAIADDDAAASGHRHALFAGDDGAVVADPGVAVLRGRHGAVTADGGIAFIARNDGAATARRGVA